MRMSLAPLLREELGLFFHHFQDCSDPIPVLNKGTRNLLAEKETINAVLRENYLLRQQVKMMSGQASEGEEDVDHKRKASAMSGSDDSTSHSD